MTATVVYNTYTCYASIIKNRYPKCRLIGHPKKFADYVTRVTGSKTKVLKNNTVVYKLGDYRMQINDNGNIHVQPPVGNVEEPFKAAFEMLKGAVDHTDPFIIDRLKYTKKVESKEIIFVGSFINIGVFKGMVSNGEVDGVSLNEKQQCKITFRGVVKVTVKPGCITLERTNTLDKPVIEVAREVYSWLIDEGLVNLPDGSGVDLVRKTPGKNTFSIPGSIINYRDIENGPNVKTKKNTFKNQVCMHVPTGDRNVSVKLFNNSQLHITGCKDQDMCYMVAKRMSNIIKECCGLDTSDPTVTIINIPSKSSVPGYVRFDVLKKSINDKTYKCPVELNHSDKTREMGGFMIETMTSGGKRISVNIFNTGIYLINGGVTHEEIQYYADVVYDVVSTTPGVMIDTPKEMYTYKLGLGSDGRFVVNTYLKGKLVNK